MNVFQILQAKKNASRLNVYAPLSLLYDLGRLYQVTPVNTSLAMQPGGVRTLCMPVPLTSSEETGAL